MDKSGLTATKKSGREEGGGGEDRRGFSQAEG